MRIVTVVTLIYLPATFVSTFFSIDIIKYQGEGSGSFLAVALFRWLQVTLPLTLVTLIVGWIAYDRAGKAADKGFENVLAPLLDASSEESGIAALPSRYEEVENVALKSVYVGLEKREACKVYQTLKYVLYIEVLYMWSMS